MPPRPRTHPSNVLAYFITFRTYGTWLHGDARTSVDRHNNVPGTLRIEYSRWKLQQKQEAMEGELLILSAAQQRICTTAIQTLCVKRQWKLRALNVRTNHVHSVITAPVLGEKVMADMKSYATRALRVQKEVGPDAQVWAHHGSTQLLFHPQAVIDACTYVVEAQGVRQGPIGDVE